MAVKYRNTILLSATKDHMGSARCSSLTGIDWELLFTNASSISEIVNGPECQGTKPDVKMKMNRSHLFKKQCFYDLIHHIVISQCNHLRLSSVIFLSWYFNDLFMFVCDR